MEFRSKRRGRISAAAAFRAAALTAVLFLGACAITPAAPSGDSDPVRQSHSQWCGSLPASGYCDLDDSR